MKYDLDLKNNKLNKMLMSDGPWNPEHIYQEIVGYGKTRQRGESIISFPEEITLICTLIF